MSKQVTINGINYSVLPNNRAIVNFERMRGKPSSNIKFYEDVLAMTYCSIQAGAIDEKKEFNMSFDDFIDYTCKHPEIMEQESEGDESSRGSNDTDKKK